MYQYPSFISAEIFRAYDIRGVVEETLTPDVVWAIGLAISAELHARGEQRIIIGRDGRLTSDMLSQALAQGLMAGGSQVVDVGAVPTPVLYYSKFYLNIPSAVMITGSHNPPEYNGLKIVIAGEVLAGEEIQALYHRLAKLKGAQKSAGSYIATQVINSYINEISAQIKLQRSYKIVIDSGNGITGLVAPTLFRRLGCEVIELYCEVDGTFPNHHPDPSELKNLQDLLSTVQVHGADLGIAFDGDGDRVGIVTEQREVIDADRLLMLFSADILTRHPHTNIVYDVKCTAHLKSWIQQRHGVPVMCQTGHSWIKRKMRALDALLAGEMSGHLFFKENWYGFDDGLYAACRLLSILDHDKKPLSKLMAEIPKSINTPELKVKVVESSKFELIDKLKKNGNFAAVNLVTLDGIRAEYEDGWGLVRASNTSSYLILRFEADTNEALQRIQVIFREQLLKVGICF